MTHPASFRKYLKERLVDRLPQPPQAFHYVQAEGDCVAECRRDRKSTRLNSSHGYISYAVFCLKKKKPPTRSRLQSPYDASATAVVVVTRHARDAPLFFTNPATTEISTLSLHDALPI